MKSRFNAPWALLFFVLLLLFTSTPRLAAQTAGTPVVQNDFTGTGSIITQNLNATGTATPLSAVASGTMNNAGDCTIQVTGTYTGALTVQVSLDGVNWIAVTSILNINVGTYSATIASGTTGIFQVGVEGCRYMEVTALAAVTGTATVSFRVSSTDSTVSIDTPLPAGSALLGAINITQVAGTTLPAVGSAASGNPLIVATAVLPAVPAAALAAGVTERIPVTSDYQLAVHLNGDPANEWTATSGTTALATATSTAAKAAGGAGIRNYVTDIHVVNTSATVGTTFSILDGASVIWTTFLPATTAALVEIPVTIHFETPLKGTAATALNVQCGTTGAAVFYNVGGYQNN